MKEIRSYRVIVVSLSLVQVPEQLLDVGHVRLGRELQRPRILEELPELGRQTRTQLGNRGLLLLGQDHLVLCLVISRFQALPGQRALHELDQHVRNGLEVVTSTLRDAQVIVDGGVTRCASEGTVVVVIVVTEVLLGVGVSLGQTKIDNIHLICLFTNTHGKISLNNSSVRP